MPEIKKILGKNPSVNSFTQSFAVIKGRLLEFPMPILSDLLFIVIYGVLVAGFIIPIISEQMFAFGMEVTKTEQKITSLSEIMLQESARPMLIKITALLLLMVVLIYILYCLFQGFSWWCCSKIALRRKEPFSVYLKGFYRTNIFWYVLVVLYNLASLAKDFLSESSQPLGIFWLIAFFVLVYFVMISYSLLPAHSGLRNIRASFSLGIRGILRILPAYIIMLAFLLLVNLLMSYSMGISNMLFLFLGVFVLMPFLGWARIYSIIVIEKAKINKL